MMSIRKTLFIALLTMWSGPLHADKLKDPPLFPIIYDAGYNLGFWGLQKLHPFDIAKYGRIADGLRNAYGKDFTFLQPTSVSDDDLLLVHTPRYLASLENKDIVSRILEIPSVLPHWMLERYVLKPMRLATGGTILAVEQALKHGCAINLSGGYHHAKINSGEGFCVYADIPIAIAKARQKNPDLKVLIVDLDAHRGNGVANCLSDDPVDITTIFDVYNCNVYPYDDWELLDFTYHYPVSRGTSDADYLTTLHTHLPIAIDALHPDLIIYNAGTDILAGDPVGLLNVSSEGICERDLFVFDCAFNNNIPIAMVLAGGYTQESAPIITKSLQQVIAAFNDKTKFKSKTR